MPSVGDYVTQGEEIFKPHGVEVPGIGCRGQAEVCLRSCVQPFCFFLCSYQQAEASA